MQLCQNNNLNALGLVEDVSKINTWNSPLYMTLVDNVAKNWEEDNDYKSTQGKDSVMDDQLVKKEK